jgi:DNA polymerase III epsilon subunit-like protein
MRYLILDTETTGTDEGAKAVELGWLEIDEDFNIIDQHETLLDPQCMIAPAASAVHGLVLDDLKDSPTIEEYFSVDDPSCYGKPFTDPCVLIGHKVSFDYRFVKAYFNVQALLCTLLWSRRLYSDMDNAKLTTMSYALGLPRPTDAHRVLSDCTTAYYLLRHIAERTGISLPQLVEASKEPRALPTVPFGKHAGKPWHDLPAPYLRWMSDAISDDLDIVFSVNQELQRRKQK